MFENYKQMTDAEKAEVRAIHKAIRSDQTDVRRNRYHILAWAFVRGIPYRRCERNTRSQLLSAGSYPKNDPCFLHTEKGVFYQHNLPLASYLTHILGKHIPGFAAIGKEVWQTHGDPRVVAWLADPAGAIPLPAPRQKLSPEAARARHEQLQQSAA